MRSSLTQQTIKVIIPLIRTKSIPPKIVTVWVVFSNSVHILILSTARTTDTIIRSSLIRGNVSPIRSTKLWRTRITVTTTSPRSVITISAISFS